LKELPTSAQLLQMNSRLSRSMVLVGSSHLPSTSHLPAAYIAIFPERMHRARGNSDFYLSSDLKAMSLLVVTSAEYRRVVTQWAPPSVLCRAVFCHMQFSPVPAAACPALLPPTSQALSGSSPAQECPPLYRWAADPKGDWVTRIINCMHCG
jgi:hypothetical protein